MKKGISQEGLKLIACISMLIDHIGYALVSGLYGVNPTLGLYDLYQVCRSVGRLAWPIYAFLLVEGISHTRDRKKYILRLAVGALLSEPAFDLMTAGTLFAPKHSVMVTLLLGGLMVMAMDALPQRIWKPVVALPFLLVAYYVPMDYGWKGIVLIGLFALSREMRRKNLIRFGGMVTLFSYQASDPVWLGFFSVPRQVLGAASMIFIAAYDGRKLTRNKVVQWAFYLFYPVHMLLLWLIGNMIFG